MARPARITGKVTDIVDHGTIVQMFVKTKRRKRPIIVVNFDHRQFWNMYEAEGSVVLGREVEVIGEEFGDQRVEFLD